MIFYDLTNHLHVHVIPGLTGKNITIPHKLLGI